MVTLSPFNMCLQLCVYLQVFTTGLWLREKALLLALKICNDSFTGASVLNSASSNRSSAKGNNQITPTLVRIDMEVFELQKISFIWMYSFVCHNWKCRNKALSLLLKWFLLLGLPPTVRKMLKGFSETTQQWHHCFLSPFFPTACMATRLLTA